MEEGHIMYSMKSMHHKNNKAGFTLVEMMIIAPIVILVIGTIVYSIVQLTGDAIAARSSAILIGTVQTALDRIEADTESSGAFLAKNNMTLTSPQGYNNGVQDFTSVSDNGSILILNTLVTDIASRSSDKLLNFFL